MILDEHELRRLALGDAVDGPPPVGDAGSARPSRPLAEIRARTAVLRRRRRAGRALGGALGVTAVAAVAVVGSGGGWGAVDRPAPAGTGRHAVPSTGGASPSAAPRPMPVMALTYELGCDTPAASWSSADTDPWDRADQVPSRLLSLPGRVEAGAPASATGGRFRCYTGPMVLEVSSQDRLGTDRVPRPTASPEPIHLLVSGPDDAHPCSTPTAARWPFEGTTTSGQARGTTVTVTRRASGSPRACARWTEPGGHAWFALTDTLDDAGLLGDIGRLTLGPQGASPEGLLAAGGSIASRRSMPFGAGFTAPRAFLETQGWTAAGSWSLLALDGGPVPFLGGTGVEPVQVAGVDGQWSAARHTLVWSRDGVRYGLSSDGGRAEALRLAASVRPVPASDALWSVYLSSASGASGTPVPPSGRTSPPGSSGGPSVSAGPSASGEPPVSAGRSGG